LSQALPLPIVIPLIGALVVPLIGLRSARAAHWFALASLLLGFGSACRVFTEALKLGSVSHSAGGWPAPWGIELVADPIGAALAGLVLAIALLVWIYSGRDEPRTGLSAGAFASLYLLLVGGLVGMTLTGDLFNLYVFIEISGLAAYALTAAGGERAVVASFRYLLVGTVASSFYLLGVGYLYALTGTLNMVDVAARLPASGATSSLVVALALITIGLAVKAALFPLHGWLPDVYSYAPTPVAAFSAGVMAKVSVYALIRILYEVLGATGPAQQALPLLTWAASIAMLAGSAMAIAQRDVRRMLAYSSVAQMGAILLGVSLANTAAMIGALLHVLHHALMKSCLFLIAGGVAGPSHTVPLDRFAGLGQRMPVTSAAFLVATLSLIGLPPTAGFFSKYYLVLGAIESGEGIAVFALVVSSLLTAGYCFRLLERVYLRSPGEDAPTGELPAAMLVPIATLAAAIAVVGFANQPIVARVIRAALPAGLE